MPTIKEMQKKIHRIAKEHGWWEGEKRQVSPLAYSWDSNPAPGPTTTEFGPGDHVHHTQFGEGVVVSSKQVKDDAEVVVAFNGGVKKLLASYAKLEKVE